MSVRNGTHIFMTVNVLKTTSILHLATDAIAVALMWAVDSTAGGYGVLALIPVLGVLGLVAVVTGAILIAQSETIIKMWGQLSAGSRVLFAASGISAAGWGLLALFMLSNGF